MSTTDLTENTEGDFKKRTFFNMKQLDKLVDFFAKEFYTGQMDKKNENKNPTSTPE